MTGETVQSAYINSSYRKSKRKMFIRVTDTICLNLSELQVGLTHGRVGHVMQRMHTHITDKKKKCICSRDVR